MDFLGLIVALIVKVLPEKVAMPVIAGILIALGVLTFMWHGHLSTQVTACNSANGRLEQLFNGAQTANCGLDGLLSTATLVAGIALLVAAIVPVGVWIYQLNHPSFNLKKFADDLI